MKIALGMTPIAPVSPGTPIAPTSPVAATVRAKSDAYQKRVLHRKEWSEPRPLSAVAIARFAVMGVIYRIAKAFIVEPNAAFPTQPYRTPNAKRRTWRGTNIAGSGDCPSESQTRTKNEYFTERNGVSPGR